MSPSIPPKISSGQATPPRRFLSATRERDGSLTAVFGSAAETVSVNLKHSKREDALHLKPGKVTREYLQNIGSASVAEPLGLDPVDIPEINSRFEAYNLLNAHLKTPPAITPSPLSTSEVFHGMMAADYLGQTRVLEAGRNYLLENADQKMLKKLEALVNPLQSKRPFFWGKVRSTHPMGLYFQDLLANLEFALEYDGLSNIDLTQEALQSVFEKAAQKRLLPTIEILMKKSAWAKGGGIDINAHNGLALSTAAFHKDIKLISALIRFKADVNAGGGYPLRDAILGGDPRTVLMLLQNGANANLAPDEADILLQPLVEAAKRGHIEIMEQLIAFNADPMRDNAVPLMAAAAAGKSEAVEFLLTIAVHDQDQKDAALMLAASRNDVVTSKILLEHGASPDAIVPLYNISLREYVGHQIDSKDTAWLLNSGRDYFKSEGFVWRAWVGFSRSVLHGISATAVTFACRSLAAKGETPATGAAHPPRTEPILEPAANNLASAMGYFLVAEAVSLSTEAAVRTSLHNSRERYPPLS